MTDLMPPVLYRDGEDPRRYRGRTVIPPDTIRHGWLNYARSSHLIQWDGRGNEGWGQDDRIPHLATAKAGLAVPSAAAFCRPTFLHNFAVPFTFSGWVMIPQEPQYDNDGFKVAVLHQGNGDMLLAQIFRRNRVASLWREDRIGGDDTRSLVHPVVDWQTGVKYRWAVTVTRQSVAIEVDGRTVAGWNGSIAARSGQVGFRLDRTVCHIGGLTVSEG